MLSFSTKKQASRTVDLPGGGTLTLRPVTTPSFEAARAAARKRLADLLVDTEGLKALGLDPETDLLKDAQEGLFLGLLAQELGARLITAWTGVADDSGEKEADVTPENIRKLMMHAVPAKVVYSTVIEEQMPDATLKKDLGTAADGTLAAAPDTAKAAAT